MKKVYHTPELNMICAYTADIITISAGENGTISSYSFSDIIDGEAGWTES